MLRKLGFASVVALCACDRNPGGGQPPAEAPPVVAAPRSFVVFTAASLVIDHLEVPIAPPVAVGSEPSPAPLTSDAPEVVSVGPGGAFLGHRNGRAMVRAAGSGSALAVEVRAVSGLSVAPAKLLLRPGTGGDLRLLAAGSGEAIPAAAASWASDAPEVALVIAGRVEARRRGSARVTASYGGAEASAEVVVRAPDEPRRRSLEIAGERR